MAAKYAKIDRVGSLDADFQQFLLVQTFWNKCVLYFNEYQKIQISEEKQKVFLNLKKNK